MAVTSAPVACRRPRRAGQAQARGSGGGGRLCLLIAATSVIGNSRQRTRARACASSERVRPASALPIVRLRSGSAYHLVEDAMPRRSPRRLDRPYLLSLTVAALALAAVRSPVLAQGEVPADAPYLNAALPIEQRVQDLISRMTLEEK